ncbi:MAG: hypothetical protein C0619_06655 [Desulfuromonas sp.]|nr:MAG: hypothetical protein C0619_06655 [Desulfuromonas sp.]
MNRFLNLFLLICLLAWMVPGMAQAAGTLAGTDITNTATVDYVVDTVSISVPSNDVTITVAELLNVDVIWRDLTNVIVKPGDTGAPTLLTFELTNTGNYDEDFDLTADNTSVVTDDFDPVDPAVIYFDANDNDTYDAGTDTLYDGTNLPTLTADESIHLFVFSDTPDVGPGDPADGDLGTTRLIAESQTITTGDPAGTAYSNAGYDGTLNAVIGASGATDSDDGIYQVSRVDVTIVKAGAVTDDNLGFGGTEAVPGATVQYTLTVNVIGGTAESLVINDPIPAEVTYDTGTLTLDTAPLTDGTGDDKGEVVENPPASGNFEVNVDLGDVTGGVAPGTTHTITFDVTID